MTRAAAIFVFLWIAAVAAPVRADITLPALFAPGMVLQQQSRVRIFGRAAPGERVTVLFQNRHAATRTNGAGDWQVWLPPMRAGGPFLLTVRGRNRVTVGDVLVDEVWLVSGQSNMDSRLRYANGGLAIAAAAYNPQIRLFQVPRRTASTPQRELRGKWEICTPRSATDFSAIGYLFAIALQRARRVPVGVIQASYSGAEGAFFLPEPAFQNPALRPLTFEYQAKLRYYRLSQARYERRKRERQYSKLPYPAFRDPPIRYSTVYNAMIAPLTRYSLRGVVWYQGESDTYHPAVYANLLPALMRSWRANWAIALPFLIVQLPPFGDATPPGIPSPWAEIREIQRQTALNLPHTALVVSATRNAEKDLHPTEKRPIAARAALVARRTVYGESVPAPPVYQGMRWLGDALVLTFRTSGLIAAGGILTGFTAKSASGTESVPARMVGKGTVRLFPMRRGITITVTVPEIRYGWSDYFDPVLQSRDGLPASSFRALVPSR